MHFALSPKARQQQVVQSAGTDLAAEHLQQQNEGTLSPRSLYQKKKIAREQLSLQLLMHLTGEQMASIKARIVGIIERNRRLRSRSLFRETICMHTAMPLPIIAVGGRYVVCSLRREDSGFLSGVVQRERVLCRLSASGAQSRQMVHLKHASVGYQKVFSVVERN